LGVYFRPKGASMPKYIVERHVIGAGSLRESELAALAQKFSIAAHTAGAGIQWVESFVTRDKIYCVFIAPNEELVRKHARIVGLPADRISGVSERIDPTWVDRAESEQIPGVPVHEDIHDAAKESGVY